jgi:phosphohistidine phosphatase SixA
MKNLFIVRHGKYDHKGLTDLGIKNTDLLGGQLKSRIGGRSIYFISSPVVRAYQSAKILAECLGVSEIEEVPYLCPDFRKDGNYYNEFHSGALDKMMKIVDEREEKADNLIMVTHHEVCKDFTPYFAKERFGYVTFMGRIDNSESIQFDLEAKSIEVLSFHDL